MAPRVDLAVGAGLCRLQVLSGCLDGDEQIELSKSDTGRLQNGCHQFEQRIVNLRVEDLVAFLVLLPLLYH